MANLYWYGGSGHFNASTGHWSLNTGNSPASDHIAPTASDNVIFNALSSTANAAYTVTLDIATDISGVCNDFTMGGPGGGNKVTFAGDAPLKVNGNLTLPQLVDGIVTYTGLITFRDLWTKTVQSITDTWSKQSRI